MKQPYTTYALLLLGMACLGVQDTLGQDPVESRPMVAITDASINAGDMVRWSASNVYVLDGLVIVEDGAELHIDAGTVIKAQDGIGVNASALVIARGGKIYAEGAPTRPIIFTSIQDLSLIHISEPTRPY